MGRPIERFYAYRGELNVDSVQHFMGAIWKDYNRTSPDALRCAKGTALLLRRSLPAYLYFYADINFLTDDTISAVVNPMDGRTVPIEVDGDLPLGTFLAERDGEYWALVPEATL